GSILIRIAGAAAFCSGSPVIVANGSHGIDTLANTAGCGGGGGGGVVFMQTSSSCGTSIAVAAGAGGSSQSGRSQRDASAGAAGAKTPTGRFCSTGQTPVAAADHCSGHLLCDPSDNTCNNCDTVSGSDAKCSAQYANDTPPKPHCETSGSGSRPQHECVE